MDTPRRLLKTPPSGESRSGNVPQTLKSEEFSELYYSEVSVIQKKCVRGAFQGGPRQAREEPRAVGRGEFKSPKVVQKPVYALSMHIRALPSIGHHAMRVWTARDPPDQPFGAPRGAQNAVFPDWFRSTSFSRDGRHTSVTASPRSLQNHPCI